MAEAAGKRRTWFGFVPFFVLVVFFVLAFVYQGNLDARATVGEAAPDFELTRLEGETVRLSDFYGRPIVLNFWTTWCTECRTEMPDLERIHRNYSGDVVVLGVNMRESSRVARSFVEEHDISYPILLDQEKRVAKTYRVTGVPETWIVSADGVALARFIGPVTSDQIEHSLKTLAAFPGEGRSGT